jgi:hypothetical protein
MLNQITTSCLTERNVSILVVVMIFLGGSGQIGPAAAQQDKQIPAGLGADGPYSQEILNDPYVASWMINNLRNIFQKEVDDSVYKYFDAQFTVSGKQNESYSGYVLINSIFVDGEAVNRTAWNVSTIAANPDTNQFDYVWNGLVSSIITSSYGLGTRTPTSITTTTTTTVTYIETKQSIKTTTEPLTYAWAVGATAAAIGLAVVLLLQRRTTKVV